MDALLLVALTARRDGSQTVVGIVAVLLTGLVIVRQLIAFRDNASLLGRLGQQERRFRSLVQNAADVITISDRTGRLTYVSLAADPALTTTAVEAREPGRASFPLQPRPAWSIMTTTNRPWEVT